MAAFAPQHVYHGVEVEQHAFGYGIPQSIEAWKTEAQRRFTAPLLIIGHGNDFQGEWCMFLEETHQIVPVRVVAENARKRFPGRDIVLICCNPYGHGLGIKGVYHARESVWFAPDKIADNSDEGRKAHVNFVGNIFEFDDN